MKPLLDVVGLSKSFGNVRAVHNLEFQVDRGMIWGFIGPNGAGKTTTMRILSTLELPDSGNAFIDGASILVDPLRARMRIGFMADHFFPYANLDVGQYLDPKSYGASPSKQAGAELYDDGTSNRKLASEQPAGR